MKTDVLKSIFQAILGAVTMWAVAVLFFAMGS